MIWDSVANGEGLFSLRFLMLSIVLAIRPKPVIHRMSLSFQGDSVTRAVQSAQQAPELEEMDCVPEKAPFKAGVIPWCLISSAPRLLCLPLRVR